MRKEQEAVTSLTFLTLHFNQSHERHLVTVTCKKITEWAWSGVEYHTWALLPEWAWLGVEYYIAVQREKAISASL